MWDPEKGSAHVATYRPFIDSIAAHTVAFGKPVLLFNGDSHVYRSDNPLKAGAACQIESGASTMACSSDAAATQSPNYVSPDTYPNVSNFHRVVVHASRDLKLGGPKSGHELTLGADGFNLLNRVNYASYVGIISSPLFRTPVSARSARQFQFSIRYKF